MKRKKIISIVLLFIFLVGIATGVFAASTIKEIKAQIDSAISVKLDGNSFKPSDAKGAEIKPIIYNDRLFVSVKDLMDKLNIAYDYNKQSKTLYLGEKAGKGTRLLDTNLSFYSGYYPTDRLFKTQDSSILTYKGETGDQVFSNGIYNSSLCYSLYMYAALNNKYQKLSFKLWNPKHSGKLSIFNNDTKVEIKNIEYAQNELVIIDSLDIGGVNNLQFNFGVCEIGTVIAEPYLN